MFASAAFGVESIALDPEWIEPVTSYRVDVAGEDLDSLLVNFLNEVIFWLDARHLGFARFDLKVSAKRVEGQAWGEPRNLERHPPRLVVKAATYHQLRITQQDTGLWIAEVYLDI